MERDKIFTCRICDADMEVDDPATVDTVVCHACGQVYTLDWMEDENVYELTPMEPVEEGTRRADDEGEEPFRVLNEPGGPRKDDLDRY